LQKEGERYFMTGLSGDPMTGTVLAADGGRDVAFSWEETDDSVVVLRSLPSPASKDERVIAMCWSRWLSASPETGAQGKAEEAEIQRVEGELKRAVQRLALVLDRSGIA
jgi:hypothetical protein